MTVTVRNRVLPGWLHRLANGLYGATLAAWLGVEGQIRVPPGGVPADLAGRLVLAGPALCIALAAIGPERLSLVRGVAGGEGYEGLDGRAPGGSGPR